MQLPSLVRSTVLVALAAFALSMPRPVLADDEVDRSNDDLVEAASDVAMSRAARSVRADSRSVALNPGMLALVEMPDLDYTVASSDAFASGHGIYGVLPLFGFLGLGASVEFLGDELDDRPYRRYRLAVGTAFADIVGLGASFSLYGSEQSVAIDDLDSVQLGLTTRIIPALVLSIVVDHVNTPRLADRWLEPVWHFGAGSALLDGRLKLDATFSTSDDTEEVVDGMISVEPIDGLEVFADTRVQLDGTARWGGGTELNFGAIGVQLAAYGLTYLGGDDAVVVGFDGITAGLTLRAEPVESLYPSHQHWVRVDVPGALDERAPRSPFGPAGISFAGLLLQLDRLATSDDVDGVYLAINGLGYGYSQLWELRQVVEKMRAHGIQVVAHLDDTSMRSYYLASAADLVYMSPGQVFAPTGIASTMTFYGGLFDLLGVNVEFVKIDEYKTAPDAWLRSSPTKPHLEQINDYVDGIFDEMMIDIAASREVDESVVRGLIDEMPMRPREAIAAGLIDGVAYEDELGARIAEDLQLDDAIELEPDTGPLRRREEAWTWHPTIAVIYIDGSIAKGPSLEYPLLGSLTTGSSTINALLDWARTDPNVAGVVIRVDSPGGSAHGSELMYHHIEQLAAVKPTIVSMSNVAASGGYYVSAPGERIFATPMTLTGSIGIFAGKFDLSGLLGRIGINQFIVKRGEFADLFSAASGWTPEGRAQVMDQITQLYEEFIQRVAEGRGMDESLVRSVGEGRVWTGRAALERNLVDEIGGLLPAIDEVKRRAGLDLDDEVVLVHLPYRSILSAFELNLPIGIIKALEDAPELEDVPKPLTVETAGLSQFLLDQLTGLVVGAGWLPTAISLAPGEPLMMLPYDLEL